MILITLDGGLVSSVLSDDPKIVGHEVIVNDYDAEGSDDYVTDRSGRECCPRREKVGKLRKPKAEEMRRLVLEREKIEQEG